MYHNTKPTSSNGDGEDSHEGAFDVESIDLRPFLWEPELVELEVPHPPDAPALLNPITAEFSDDGETKSVVAHAP
jgi:hypothetical protein